MNNCNSERVNQKYKELKKKTQQECRKEHNNYLNSIFNEDSHNKKLFSYIKSKDSGKSNIFELRDANGIIHQKPVKKAEILNNQFCSVFSDPKTPINEMNQKPSAPKMPEIKVNIKGVFKLSCKT